MRIPITHGLELDEAGLCNFAALIYGLQLINEREREMGLSPGSIKVDGSALAVFVAAKGQQIFHAQSRA